MSAQALPEALAQIRAMLLDPDQLVRAVAAGRRHRGTPPPWRRVEVRPVDLKGGRRLQVVTYDETQASTRNEEYGPPASEAVDLLLAVPFGNWHVRTRTQTVQLRVTKKGDAQVHAAVSGPDDPAGTATDEAGAHAHDRAKPRLLEADDPLLRELGISDAHGRVKPSRQAKYRQVEEMLRALDAVRDAWPAGSGPLRVVDLGCGNAYLSFAAYRYLSGPHGVGRPVEMVGVDVKTQAREHGEKVAASLGWSGSVRFVQGTALDAPVDGADVVLALHACDTATDEALARAVRWQAPLVLASPCCHHDIQRQLVASGAVPEPYGLVTRHAILRERWSDVLTDALRASVLRLLGYRVEVVEFVGSEHTPRNTLIRAVRTGAAPTPQQVADYAALTRQWHVTPRLAALLADRLAGVLADVLTDAPPAAAATAP